MPPLNALEIEPLARSVILICPFIWWLLGILSIQIHMYRQVFWQKDKLVTKCLVSTVFACQIIQAVVFAHTTYRTFVTGFGNLEMLDELRENWVSGCILVGLVSCMVQLFYAWRIWIISARKLPSILIVLASLCSLAASFVTGISSSKAGRYSKLLDSKIVEKAQWIWQGAATAAACDTLIAGCMTYYLKRRSPEGAAFGGTISLINKIVRLTIESGTLTASLSIATIVLTFFPRRTPYFLVLVSTISGSYASTLMVILNSRIKFVIPRNAEIWQDSGSEVASDPRPDHSVNANGRRKARTPRNASTLLWFAGFTHSSTATTTLSEDYTLSHMTGSSTQAANDEPIATQHKDP